MSRLNVTASSLVYSHTLRDLYVRIGDAGWSVKKVKFDKKDDCYVASAKNPHGDEIEKSGPDEDMAVRNLLLAIERKNHMRSAAMEHIGMWKADWSDQLQPIAEAYAKAPVYDPKAAAAYKALADDSMRRAEVLRKQLHIEEVNDPEPYPHAQAMADDIHKRQHFLVSTANSEHPLWTPEQNTAFRIVHDVLGHSVSGGDFGWEGENKACFVSETLIHTDHGYKPISEIVVGDWVLSANGKYNKVYAVMEREYEGDLVELTTNSTVAPILATPEHPFKKLRGQHRSDRTRPCMPGWCGHRNPEQHHTIDWTPATDLREGDWLSFVVPEDIVEQTHVGVPQQYRGRMRACPKCQANRGHNGTCQHMTEYVGGPVQFELTDDFLWAIGLYLAEGCASANQIVFSLHIDEVEFQQRLKMIFEGYGYGVAIRPRGENGCEVQVRNAILSRWFPEWLGKGCENKQIPSDLMELPLDKLVNISQGVFDGDGAKKTGQLGQTSPILALQIMEISARLDNDPTVSVSFPENKKPIYTVDEVLEPRIRKRNGFKKGTWNLLNHSLRRVLVVNRRPYKGKVYNLSVENDETYVVQNIAVHNCAAHFPLLSAEAQKALFSECIAQTGYAAHYRNFGPQKVALFPQFYEPAQKAEGVHPNFQGIHPSQSVAPTAMPAIKPSKPVGLPQDNIAPHEQEAQGMPVQMNYVPGVDVGRTGSVMPGQDVDPTLTDPNAGYQTGIQPMEPNAYLHHGDPLQAQETMDNASLIDTEWSKLRTGENKPDYERMKLAIVNAFRAVLLSPRKDLRWNTIHYQDISGVPPGVTDPSVYWDALENKRQAWNVKNFGENARYSHRPYFKLLPLFERAIYDRNPQAGWESAKERTQRELFDWEQEEQERIMEADEKLPEDARMNHFEIEKEANKALAKKIEMFLAEHKAYDQPNLFTAAKKEPTQEDSLFPLEPQIQQTPKLDRYGAFMGTHLKAIAQISTHVDALLKAALEDVHEHDGSGHHFRSAVMQLGVPGCGPKVCSFAWLLLQPTTSQLATIDTHIMDVLGHNYDKDMSTRDYFKFERELQAGRDASGYEHVPLGAFQWGMWDNKRTGEGSHQDHSGLRVLDPVPYDAIDWQSKEQPINAAEAVQHKQNWHSNAPDWWKATQPARDQVGDEWDEHVLSPKTQVPFQTVASIFKTASVLRTPWFTHPQTGEHLTGQPGQTLMQHATQQLHLSTPAVWAALGDDSAGKS